MGHRNYQNNKRTKLKQKSQLLHKSVRPREREIEFQYSKGWSTNYGYCGYSRSSSFHFIPKFFNFFLALFDFAIATHLDLVVVSKIGSQEIDTEIGEPISGIMVSHQWLGEHQRRVGDGHFGFVLMGHDNQWVNGLLCPDAYGLGYSAKCSQISSIEIERKCSFFFLFPPTFLSITSISILIQFSQVRLFLHSNLMVVFFWV